METMFIPIIKYIAPNSYDLIISNHLNVEKLGHWKSHKI